MSYLRLSQAEIDMLLGGGDSSSEESSLSAADMDTIGEIGTTAAGAAATSLGEMLSLNVSLTNPVVETQTLEQVCHDSSDITYISGIRFDEGFNGEIFLVVHEAEARIIVDIQMGNDGSNPPEELGEMELSALSEAISQLSGNMMTAFSALFKKKVIAITSEVQRYDLAQLETPLGITLDDNLVRTTFRFELGTLADSTLSLMIPVGLAKDLTRAFEAATMPMPAAPPAETHPVETSTPQRDNTPIAAAAMPAAAPVSTAAYSQAADHNGSVGVQPVQFTPFAPSAVGAPGNLNLILDVPLQITVELGRTKRQVKEVLDLGSGSIIELDKLTGDPVDILINGKPIAEGEVVIIDENFAVRITKIKNMADRLGVLQ